MPTEPNYYQLLELSPDVDDWPTIEKRINEKQSQWSMESSQGDEGKRRRATVYRDLIPKMREELKIPAIRHQHQERERQQLDEVRQKLLAKLEQFAKVLRSKPGGCTEADMKKISGWLGAGWDELKVRKELERRGVSFASATAPKPARETLDPTLAKALRDELDFLVERGKLRQPDLYELLGHVFGPSMSCDQLRNETNSQEKKLRGKTDPVSSAKLALLGHCRTLLGDARSKARYDNYRATRAMEPFKEHLRLGAGDAKIITPALADEVVRQAAALGIPAGTARHFIEDFAAQAKFTLLPRDDKAGVPPQCGFCYAMAASPDDRACHKCGKPLWIDCPNPRCKTRVPTQAACCPMCGYSTGNAPLFFAKLGEARKLLAEGALERAHECIEPVLRGWRDSPEALELEKQIQQRSVEQARAEEELRALLAQNLGEEVLRGCPRLRNASFAVELRATAERLIARARQLVEDGRRRQAAGDADGAIDHFEDALRVCADHTEARTALAACPPEPPQRLCAVIQAGIVALEWRGSPSRGGLCYRVIRKAGSAPRRPNDGTVVDVIGGTTLIDDSAPVGEPIYYAVYTERGGVASVAAAVEGPLFRVVDVSGVRALGRDGCVELTWRPPPNACRIEVWRKPDLPPARRGDGTALPLVSVEAASDSGLVNGRPVGYRVIAVFCGPDDQPCYALGAIATATPVSLPRPVAGLNAFRSGDDIEVTWTAPVGANVAVFVSDRRPECRPGDLLSAEELSGLGQRLSALGPNSARGRTQRSFVLHLTPVSIAGGTAVIGQSIRLTTIEEVTNVQVRLTGQRLICQWEWPPGIRTALVAWRGDRFPTGPGDRVSQHETCQRFHYDQQGGFSLEAPEGWSQLFLAVYAMSQGDDGWQYSPGTADGARCEVLLSACYRVRYYFGPRKWLRRLFQGGDYELRVTPEDEAHLPELVLVVRSGRVPLDRDDGMEVLRIPPGTICSPQSPLVELVFATSLPSNPKGQLFPVDPDANGWLNLQRES